MTGPRDERRLYDDLAWLWPTMSPPEHYRDEAEVYATLARAHARRPVKTVLHLGCGGGHIDHWLRHHCAVTGLDLIALQIGIAEGAPLALRQARKVRGGARPGRVALGRQLR